MKTSSFSLAASLLAMVSAHPQEVKPVSEMVSDKSEYTRCGQNELTANQRSELEAVVSNRTSYMYYATRKVDTYVHIITTEASKGNYTEDMVNNQIDVLNDAYSTTGFSFQLAGTDYTAHDAWASVSAGTDLEVEMKTALHQGSYSDLNLYFISDLGDGLLGFCYFPTPSPSASTKTLDGCVHLAASLPNGGATNFEAGMTAVHEVGHWFGLYHVFDGNSCDGNGDYVKDTPTQARATSGCPAKQDSCPGEAGSDSIHNYMDYSYDECLYEFTDGQSGRMRALWDMYRSGK